MRNLLSPKHFFYFSKTINPWLIFFFLISFSYGLIGGLVLAPADSLQGEGFRIMYVHVPCAFLSLLVYCMMAFGAFLGLTFRLKLAYLLMRESIAPGAVFTLLALISGSLWGKPMWGTWWIWDARLTSEFILLFIYVGILLFQSAVSQKQQRDRLVAILVLIGFFDIPIIHFSVSWWNTLHQGTSIKLFSHSTIAPVMLYPLIAMICASTIYFLIILIKRMESSWTSERIS